MRKFLFLVPVAAIGYAFYEQSKPSPNIWVSAAAVVIAMMGMMWLSSKVPSKHAEDDDDKI
jgi:hypothetical protein